MSVQQNPFQYAECIQYQLAGIVDPVPVYAAFNRNWATQQKFVTWQLRNVHQPVYTGQTQNNKGIDRPIFQISVFTKDMDDAFDLSNTGTNDAGPAGPSNTSGAIVDTTCSSSVTGN